MKKNLFYLIVFLGILMATGCIRSRIILTSQPSGVDVTMNNVYRGRTPIIIPFGWYWYYDFVLEKEGYQNLKVQERLHAPFWCWIPFDLIMEAIPLRFYDNKHLTYTLKPVEVP